MKGGPGSDRTHTHIIPMSIIDYSCESFLPNKLHGYKIKCSSFSIKNIPFNKFPLKKWSSFSNCWDLCLRLNERSDMCHHCYSQSLLPWWGMSHISTHIDITIISTEQLLLLGGLDFIWGTTYGFIGLALQRFSECCFWRIRTPDSLAWLWKKAMKIPREPFFSL